MAIRGRVMQCHALQAATAQQENGDTDDTATYQVFGCNIFSDVALHNDKEWACSRIARRLTMAS